MTDLPPEGIIAGELRRTAEAVDKLRCEVERRVVPGNSTIYGLLCVPPIWACIALAGPESVFATSPAYTQMARLATEEFWSVASGIIAFLAVLLGATRERRAAALGSLLLGLWHGLASVCIFVAAPNSLGTAPFVALAVLSYMVLWKAL